ncbi:MAG: glucose 1-dehydrogenase [Acidiferrobacteraceae bacterium]
MIPIDLTGRRALVTGASSGLGHAIAVALAGAGAEIGVHFHTEQAAAAEVVAGIQRGGGKAQAFGGDVSDPVAVERLFKAVDAAFGGLDILVNNAGMDGRPQLCADSDPAVFAKTISVDLLGPYYCAREALRRMRPMKRGVIIQITSVHEFIPWSGYSAYTSAKAGLSMFTKTLAQEVAGDGIRVLAIAPGAIRTPINANVWQDPAGLADLDRKVPMGRMGEPQEIGQVAAFLASDLASYVTGTTVVVDGGMLLYPDFRHGG